MDLCKSFCYNKSAIVKVTNYYSESFVECKDISKLNINHPSVLKIGNCEESYWPKHPCTLKWNTCDGPITNLLLYCFITLFFICLISLMLLRSRIMRNDIKTNNYKVKYDKMGINLNKDNINLKYSYLMIILYLLCGFKLTNSCIIFDNMNKTITQLGTTICTTESNITLNEIYYKVYLSKIYDTFEWRSESNFDWGCASGSCPSINDCYENENSLRKVSINYWVRDYCTTFPKACFMGRGCVYGIVELFLKNKYTVYSLDYVMKTSIRNLNSGDCIFEINNLEDQLLGSTYLIKNRTNSWICSSISNLDSPAFNQIGDIQMIKEDELLFPWNSLECGKNWFRNECIIPKSSLLNINNICTKLPSFTKWGYMTNFNNNLLIKENSNIEVTYKCNKTKIINNTSCYNIKIELWGIKSHSSGLYLAISGNSNQKGSDMTIKNPCDNFTLTLPCNNKIQYVKVSEEDYPCNSVMDNTLSNVQSYYINSISSGHFTHIDSLIHSSSTMLGIFSSISGSSIIIIIIIILLIRK